MDEEILQHRLRNDDSDATSESHLNRCNFTSVPSDLGRKVAHFFHDARCSFGLSLPFYWVSYFFLNKMKFQPSQFKCSMFPGRDLSWRINPALSPAVIWNANIKELGVGEQNKEQRVSDIWLLHIGPLVVPSARSALLFCSATLHHLPCSPRCFLLKHSLRIDYPHPHVSPVTL